MRTSGDSGQTWSPPVDLVSKARRGAALGQWAMAVRGPGQVAVAYLTAHSGGGLDGTVTVQRGRLLVSAMVHNGLRPLVTTPTSAKDDYIDLDVSPDGLAWGAFYADCNTQGPCTGSSPNPLAKLGALLHIS